MNADNNRPEHGSDGDQRDAPANSWPVALVADNDPLRRWALADVVGRTRPHMRVVEAECLQCLLDRLSRTTYELLCIDLDMPGLAGDLLEEVVRGARGRALVFLAGRSDPSQIAHLAGDLRIRGVVSKSASIIGLKSALRIVLTGARCLQTSERP